ncbi:MAG TPA: alpha/beta hydrolase [Burkholderiales bacterium]|nr:alpha/beta hydrolase [Burkholderiales bacterium]
MIASIVKLLVALAVALAVALPLVVYFLQDRLIFFPQPLGDARRAETAARFPVAREVFAEATDGTRLHAWHMNSGPDLVLYFGGNAEEVSWMLDAARAEMAGTSWLLTDYRGYGASAGSPSERHLVADALSWYDYAVNELGARRIFAFGRSLGSGVAVALAAQRSLAGVILSTPYDSLVAVAQRYYPYLPVRWLLRHRFDSIALAPRLKAPLLCLIAGHDEVIPPSHAERLYQAWGGPRRKLVLAGARHNETDAAPEFWPEIRRFVSG